MVMSCPYPQTLGHRLERFAKDKYSSFFQIFINCGVKSFIAFCTGVVFTRPLAIFI
jgi:hypothetical protein